jgi:hypothetical protein
MGGSSCEIVHTLIIIVEPALLRLGPPPAIEADSDAESWIVPPPSTQNRHPPRGPPVPCAVRPSPPCKRFTGGALERPLARSRARADDCGCACAFARAPARAGSRGSSSRPVIIRGATDGWPAMRRWPDLRCFARSCGHRTVPVEVGRLRGGRKQVAIDSLKSGLPAAVEKRPATERRVVAEERVAAESRVSLKIGPSLKSGVPLKAGCH